MSESNDKNLKLDISSTAIEKGIDLAKGFLEKFITPSVEETGLLLKEKVTFWRFKNQVKMLNKAQEYCSKNNIMPKAISLKLLCPLIENASLEEDEFLEDKWAILLGNMIDSEQNIQNHVFPFLLGQISKPEFEFLEQAVIDKEKKLAKLNIELNECKKANEEERIILKYKLNELGGTQNLSVTDKWKLEQGFKELDKKESKIESDILKPFHLQESLLQEFEVSNLIRLGLIKATPQHSAFSYGAEIENDPNSRYLTLDDLEIEIENEGDVYTMTQLGEMFFKACQEKTTEAQN